MPTVAMKKLDGSANGSLELSAEAFPAEGNSFVVREALNAFEANQRQGTHSTKTRGFVSGGGKKPWRQKGTGRARAGSTRSPIWRHGAIVFGPKPRDYREKVNRRKRRIALSAVLGARLAEGRLLVIDSAEGAPVRTKEVAALAKRLGAQGRTLFVTREVNDALVRSTRNHPMIGVQVANALDVYQLLCAETLVFTKDALEAVQANLEKN
ncbi:MAG: 50S ribosomal protein L4 [Candidatus Sumerlaeia bacterium]|nr:50S ribosomal protein L4 [Candidatus Sumerlaeia bacterium]